MNKTENPVVQPQKAYDVSVAWTMEATVRVRAVDEAAAEEMVDEIPTHHLDGKYLDDSYRVQEDDGIVEVEGNPPPDVELLQDWLAVAIVHPYTHRDDPLAGHFSSDGCTWNVGVETLDPAKVLKELKSARPHGMGEQHPDEIMLFHTYKGTPRLLHHWISGADYPTS